MLRKPLLNNETKHIAPSCFWVEINGLKLEIPVIRGEIYEDVDYSSVNGEYILVTTKHYDNELAPVFSREIYRANDARVPSSRETSIKLKVEGFQISCGDVVSAGRVFGIKE